MKPDVRGGTSAIVVIAAIATAGALIASQFAEDWFPSANPLVANVLAALIVTSGLFGIFIRCRALFRRTQQKPPPP
jgi:formate hydrogenlyase subunit 3/multisubunit Na+/H+ antiporter MnhD subunit